MSSPYRGRLAHARFVLLAIPNQHNGVIHMTMKTTTSFLGLAGACALALTGPASLAVPPTPTPPGPAPDVAASSLPVGDVDTALRSKSGETTAPEPSDGREDPTAIVGIIVQLQDGALVRQGPRRIRAERARGLPQCDPSGERRQGRVR